MAKLSVIAGIISFLCGLLVFAGYTRFLLGVGVGVLSLRGTKALWFRIGFVLSILGASLGVIGLLR